MEQVVCPHCDQVFEMDAAGYAEIVKQIKNAEFETEIHQRLQSEGEKHLLAIKVAEAKIKEQSAKNITDKDKQIGRLKNELESAEIKAKLEVNEAKSPLEGEIRDLLNQIKLAEQGKELLEKTLNDSHQVELKSKQDIIDLKDDEISRIKDMKLKMSVKEIGEKLEKWCENQFDAIRASTFPNASFGKDQICRLHH